MCILNIFTEVDILYFGCMELKILLDFHKKVKTPSCYIEKILIVGFFQEHESKPKTLSWEFYGNLLILYSKVYRSSIGKL